MDRKSISINLAIALIAVLAPVAALTADESDEFVAGEVIVTLLPGADIAALNAAWGTTLVASIPNQRIHLLLLPDGMDEATFELLIEEDPAVDGAELNYDEPGTSDSVEGGTQGFFFDAVASEFEDQSLWTVLGRDPAHATATGSGMVVGVLDTGLDATHAHFSGTTVLPGYDFIDESTNTDDAGNGIDDDGDLAIDEFVGHGTFMAGLIAELAPDAALLPVRVLDSDGRSQSFRVAQGIYFAVEQGADVINLSLGSHRETELLEQAIEFAGDNGVLVVAPVGNLDESDPLLYPSATSGVVAVAATDEFDVKATFSSFGEHVVLSAPGIDVFSVVPGGYARADGTSIATALVTSAIALVRSTDPDGAPETVTQRLLATAVNLDATNPAYAGLLGARIDLAAALDGLVSHDLDGDGEVGFTDILVVLSEWGVCGEPGDCPADLDGSGEVDFGDLLLVLANWG